MNTELLKSAKIRVPNVSVLINMVSIRVHQLINGQRPLIKQLSPDTDLEDIALQEIAEGKIVAEIDFPESDDN